MTETSKEKDMKVWVEFDVADDGVEADWVGRVAGTEDAAETQVGEAFFIVEPLLRDIKRDPAVLSRLMGAWFTGYAVHTAETAREALNVIEDVVIEGEVGETGTDLRREALDQAIRYASDFSIVAGHALTKNQVIEAAEEFHTFLTGVSGNEDADV